MFIGFARYGCFTGFSTYEARRVGRQGQRSQEWDSRAARNDEGRSPAKQQYGSTADRGGRDDGRRRRRQAFGATEDRCARSRTAGLCDIDVRMDSYTNNLIQFSKDANMKIYPSNQSNQQITVGIGNSANGPNLLQKLQDVLRHLLRSPRTKLVGGLVCLFVVSIGTTLTLVTPRQPLEPRNVVPEETGDGAIKEDTDGDGVPDADVGDPHTSDTTSTTGSRSGQSDGGSNSTDGQSDDAANTSSPAEGSTSEDGSPSGGSSGANCMGSQHTPGGPDSFGGCWPGAHNTGIPSGTVLDSYTGCSGDTTVITTDGTVIDAKTVNCTVVVRAADVVIKRSKINGAISLDTDLVGSSAWSFRLEDSEVDSTPDGPQQVTSISNGNFIILRSEITGGSQSVACTHDCEVRDSWLHGQEIPDDVDWHLSAIRLSQRSTAVHNTLSCDVAPNAVDGGCSANQTGYPDFEPTKNWLMERNLLIGNSGVAYCSYGGAAQGKPYSGDPENATHIVYRDNVYQRGPTNTCGAFGPITTFDSSRTGNIWTNNRWDDGSEVPAVN